MKNYGKNLIFLVYIFVTSSVSATIKNDLVLQLHSGIQTDISAIIAPQFGMVVVSDTDKKIYYYNGTNWIKLLTSPIVLTKSTNYTLVLSDDCAILRFNSGTDVTLTIPSGLPVGFNISIYQVGTGKVSMVGSGVIVKNRLSRFKTAGKDAGVGAVSTATNVFHLTGDLKK